MRNAELRETPHAPASPPPSISGAPVHAVPKGYSSYGYIARINGRLMAFSTEAEYLEYIRDGAA